MADAKLLDASVKISVRSADGHQWSGSGTVCDVDGGRALVQTCAHLFESPVTHQSLRPATVVVNFRSGLKVEATVLGVDPSGADLAAVTIPADASTPYVPLGTISALYGTSVWQVGYPAGVGPHSMTGNSYGAAGFYYGEAGTPCLVLGMHSHPGDSGSGVFQGGKFVGVIWGGPAENRFEAHATDSRRPNLRWVQRHGDSVPLWGQGAWPADAQAFATDLAQIQRFQASPVCLPWRRRQPPPQQPVQPPQGPAQPPVQPPTVPQPPDLSGPLQDVAGRVKRLEDLIATLQQGGAQAGDRLKAAEGLLANLKADIDRLKALPGVDPKRIANLEQLLSDAQINLAGLAAAIEAVNGKVAPLAGAVADHGALLGQLAPLASWVTALPILATTGGAGAVVIPLALFGLSLLKRRAQNGQPTGGAGPSPTQPAAPSLPGTTLADIAAVIDSRVNPLVQRLNQAAGPVAQQAAQAAQQAMQHGPVAQPQTSVVQTPEFVPVPVGNTDLNAWQQALKTYARKLPGNMQVVNEITDLFKIIKSGGSSNG